MRNVRVFEKKIEIPTYGAGKPQKAPMFFEKRVYQGSSGRVYPNAVTEKIRGRRKNALDYAAQCVGARGEDCLARNFYASLLSETDEQQAKRAYTLALRGDLKVADNMYYNDTPAEYVYFAAKAKIKLGDKTGASETARAFAEYARQNKGRHVKIDYFAVSLPDFLVWEQDLDERNDEFCDRVQGYMEEIYKEVKQ